MTNKANATKSAAIDITKLTDAQLDLFLTWHTDTRAYRAALKSGAIDEATDEAFGAWEESPEAVSAGAARLAAIADMAERERVQRERLALARSISARVLGESASASDVVSRHVRTAGTVTMKGDDGKAPAKLRARSVNSDGDYVVVTVVPAAYVTKAQLAEVRADADKREAGVDVSVRNASFSDDDDAAVYSGKDDARASGAERAKVLSDPTRPKVG